MLKIELLDWQAAQREAKRIRFKVFVEEQGVPRELEMDENDAQSLHALAYADGRAIGTGRLLPDGHIGRMAVLKEWRGRPRRLSPGRFGCHIYDPDRLSTILTKFSRQRCAAGASRTVASNHPRSGSMHGCQRGNASGGRVDASV